MESASNGAVISYIEPQSIADQLEVAVGDKIRAINSQTVNDLIDYRFHCAEEFLEIDLQKKNGELWVLEIEKEIDEDLGISFENAVFDRIKPCHNKCVFCFVDQMPANMRKTLYVKDDDYRLSFLQGNYITLTNLKEKDIERIIRLRLSPLYVSVHAIDENVRKIALNNLKAAESLKLLNKLVQAGIQLHTQVVLVPELNDGRVLENTVASLVDMHPNVLSLAVVPVGLTKHRQGLSNIRSFSATEAEAVLEFIEKAQKQYLPKLNTRFVFASDEFYFIADRAIPELDSYEDFRQLENGVGLTRLFWHQAEEWLTKHKKLANRGKSNINYRKTKKYIIITGKSGEKALAPVIQKLVPNSNFQLELVVVKNNWFGDSVTVTGLLTGADIIDELSSRDLDGKTVLLPDVLLRKNDATAVFLDDMTLKDFKKLTQAPVMAINTTGAGLLNVLFREEEDNG